MLSKRERATKQLHATGMMPQLKHEPLVYTENVQTAQIRLIWATEIHCLLSTSFFFHGNLINGENLNVRRIK